MQRRPNILFLIADDHCGRELGHIPGSQARTPVLDALAARGTSFREAHCQGSMLGAVCVPSRASLLTGRNIFAAAMDPTGSDYLAALTVPPMLETFPQALRAAGYHTHAVGKWHNDTATFTRAFAGGDLLMFGGMADHEHVPVWDYDPDGQNPGTDFDDRAAMRLKEGHATGSGSRVAEGFSTDLFADAAIRFIEGWQDDQPFLLYTAFTAPHDPRTPPPGWEVDPATVELPPNWLPEHPFDNGELKVRDELLAGFPRMEDEVRQHIADYRGMIAHLDFSIGRILEALEATGLASDTVVIYTSDHGLAVGQHGLMGKQNLYEHSLRVPLVMAGPGIPRGEACYDLVWHADTTATVRALAGVEANPDAEGYPIVAAGEVTADRLALGAAYGFTQRAYREGEHKLVTYRRAPAGAPHGGTTPGEAMTQLFDLAADPWETTNLADEPSMREIREGLELDLAAWQRAVGDPLPGFLEG